MRFTNFQLIATTTSRVFAKVTIHRLFHKPRTIKIFRSDYSLDNNPYNPLEEDSLLFSKSEQFKLFTMEVAYRARENLNNYLNNVRATKK